MNDLNELRKVSIEFRRLSSNFLRTTDDDNFLYVKRLYAYLCDQPIIQKIISDTISSSEYDCESFISEDKSWSNNYQVNVPINETDHIKAMYGLLTDLATNYDGKRLYGIAASFENRQKSFNETIQKFLDRLFKPLIDFIIDTLSKGMMSLEPIKPTAQYSQHIQNNYGTANAGETITSINTVCLVDLQEIGNLIATLKTEVENCSATQEAKDSVLDDLEVIDEQVKSDEPKPSRLKKAIAGVKSFIADATKGVATATALTAGATTLYQKIEQIIANIAK